MDYFQGIVTDYLRADRSVFLNTEFCIQLNPGANPDTSGPHWYCDAVAVNHRERSVYLCEITYSKSLAALQARLTDWATHWPALKVALSRDSGLPSDWPVRPWIFIPELLVSAYEKRLKSFGEIGYGPDQMPPPRVTSLEEILPWKYRSWDRTTDSDHARFNGLPLSVPEV